LLDEEDDLESEDASTDEEDDDDDEDDEDDDDELDASGPADELEDELGDGEENPFGSSDDDAEKVPSRGAGGPPDLTKLTARQRAAYTDSFAEPLMMLPEGASRILIRQGLSALRSGLTVKLASRYPQSPRRSNGRRPRRKLGRPRRPADARIRTRRSSRTTRCGRASSRRSLGIR